MYFPSGRIGLLLVIAIAGLMSIGAIAAPLRLMILDGESGGTYHRWDQTTPVLRRALEETGLFKVDVVTAPPAGADFSGFKPRFDQYRVVVVNYDAPDGRWPEELKASFEHYVKQGGGVVMVHAADNAFPGWNAWNQMNGVGGWRGRNEQAGPWWHYVRGGMVADTSPGAAGSHGRRDPFVITVRGAHPITRGLPASFIHGGDELYAHLRGPGRNMRVLATAWSDPANAGSGRHEPMLMVLRYGRGRIFHTTLGHDVAAMASVDFVVTLQRGAEWAARGKVSQSVPSDFPADAVRVRPSLLSID
jgi:uncharacterized protein